jgi:S1-C subfamily serine protease
LKRTVVAVAVAALGAGSAFADATPESMDAVEATARRVAAEATAKTVAVRVVVGDTTIGWGSGAIVSPEGQVLTCAHVTEAAGEKGKLSAVFADGSERALRVLGTNSVNDLALCRMWPGKRGAAHFEVAAEDPKKGEYVLGLGHPGGPFSDWRPTVTVGRVVEPKRRLPILGGGDKHYNPGIQTDVPLFGGNSGGPLVDLSGRLVGINGAILLVGDAAFSIPASRIQADLPRLRAREDVEGDEIPFAELFKALGELQKEVDPKELVDAYASEGIGLLAKILAALESSHLPSAARSGRRLDDLRSAYGARAASWGRTGELRVGDVRAGLALLWDRRGGLSRWVASARLVPAAGAAIVPPGADETARPARVLGRDGEWDLALLETRAPAGAADVAPPRAASDVAPAAWVLFPARDGGLFQGGAVAAADRALGRRKLSSFSILGLLKDPNTSPFRPFPKSTHVDVPLRADEFGAPAFRPDGALVGVAVAHHYRAASFLVPADVVVSRIDDLARGIDVAAPPTYDPREVEWREPGAGDAKASGPAKEPVPVEESPDEESMPGEESVPEGESVPEEEHADGGR